MWFKLFVLVRFPISAYCLLGCAMLLQFAGACVGVILLGLLAFLVFVSIRLVQFHEDALGLAGVLLLLEIIGGVLILAMGNYLNFPPYTPLTWVGMAGFVGLVWTLPNAVILYFQRAKFTEPAKEKPGL